MKYIANKSSNDQSLFLIPDYPIKDLVQNAVWMTGMGIHIPWAGLDTAGCKYLNGNCTLDSVVDVKGQVKPQRFEYPIEILNYYPAVTKFFHLHDQVLILETKFSY